MSRKPAWMIIGAVALWMFAGMLVAGTWLDDHTEDQLLMLATGGAIVQTLLTAFECRHRRTQAMVQRINRDLMDRFFDCGYQSGRLDVSRAERTRKPDLRLVDQEHVASARAFSPLRQPANKERTS